MQLVREAAGVNVESLHGQRTFYYLRTLVPFYFRSYSKTKTYIFNFDYGR